MIKVNLLRNRAEGSNQGTNATQVDNVTSIDSPAESMSGAEIQQVALKFVVILLSTAGLWGYETYNIDNLKETNQTLTAQNVAMQNEIKEKQPIAVKAKELQKKITDLEGRIKIIKDLSKTRLREIKAMDYIQNVIPEKVWLTVLDIHDEKVKIEGSTMSDDQLNKFIEMLDGKSYFQNVILLRAVEQKSKEGTIKTFEISSALKATD